MWNDWKAASLRSLDNRATSVGVAEPSTTGCLGTHHDARMRHETCFPSPSSPSTFQPCDLNLASLLYNDTSVKGEGKQAQYKEQADYGAVAAFFARKEKGHGLLCTIEGKGIYLLLNKEQGRD